MLRHPKSPPVARMPVDTAKSAMTRRVCGQLFDGIRTLLITSMRQGVDARVVMEILGHSQIGLTQNTYQHVVPVLAPDAADKMAKALWD